MFAKGDTSVCVTKRENAYTIIATDLIRCCRRYRETRYSSAAWTQLSPQRSLVTYGNESRSVPDRSGFLASNLCSRSCLKASSAEERTARYTISEIASDSRKTTASGIA